MQQGPHTFVGYMFCQKTGGRSQQQTTSTARTKVNLMTRMMELESLGNPICQFLCFKNKKETFDKICKNLGSTSHVRFEDMLEAESIRQTFVDLLTFGVKLVGLYGCNIPWDISTARILLWLQESQTLRICWCAHVLFWYCPAAWQFRLIIKPIKDRASLYCSILQPLYCSEPLVKIKYWSRKCWIQKDWILPAKFRFSNKQQICLKVVKVINQVEGVQ